MTALFWYGSFAVFCLLIAVKDLRCRKVSNTLLIVVTVLYSFWLAISPGMPLVAVGSERWGRAVFGFVLALILFYPLWRFRALGAGDVKFIAVLGFLLGPAGLFPVLLLGTVACGFHALGMVLLMGWTRARNVWRASSATRRGVPYAAYLALAAIAWMFWKVSEAGLRIV